jgi:4-hydroxy-4-methyl-2-oxoglutarate aldolase
MAMGFPVFTRGIRPLDSMGRARVMAYDVPVQCGDVLVCPSELVFADFDGAVVVPREVEDEVLRRAAEKAGRENASRAELLAGKTLREVFDKYGVL